MPGELTAEPPDLGLPFQAEQGPQALLHTSRLVFSPAARRTSRMSLSSITIFVRIDVYVHTPLYTFTCW